MLLKDLIILIFGEYVPLTYFDSLGNEIPVLGVAGVDWPYVLGVFGFFLTLYCVLRILGSVINRV